MSCRRSQTLKSKNLVCYPSFLLCCLLVVPFIIIIILFLFFSCSWITGTFFRAALNAGTVGFDRNIFSGESSLSDLKDYSVSLTAEEQAFLDGETQALCETLDDYKITQDRDMSEEQWVRCREGGFFGMMVPKEYGGKGFSAHARGLVIQKIATRSGSASVNVTVPNSLGPAEILLRYGTDEQKDFYLPQLATGKLLPCFGLLMLFVSAH